METIFFDFFRHWFNWKRFLVNYKPSTFIQSFYLLVDTIREIKCRPIFKEEQYSCSLKPFSWICCRYSCEWKQLFPANGNGVFIKSFIKTSVYRFGVNFKACAFIQSFFLLLESITEIRCKPGFFDFFSF